VHAVIRQEDIALRLTRLPGSARNQMERHVVRLEREGTVTMAHLDLGRPRVMLAFKATAIHLV
jgi:hypothetical protein